MMRLASIERISIENKRVLLRIDGDVPIDGQGRIRDDYRLQAAIPTIKWCLEQGASVVLLAHRGRPEGKVNQEFSNTVVAQYFQHVLERQVPVFSLGQPLPRYDVSILENVRFWPGEEANDRKFAQKIADYGDIFCNDAFAVSHRAHASVSVLAELLPHGAGFQLQEEVRQLTPLREHADAPFVAIMGGAKVSDKAPIIADLLDRVDAILIGGLISIPYLAATGYFVGAHKANSEEVKMVQACLRQSHEDDVPIVVPVDFVNQNREVKAVTHFAADDLMLDIGPQTLALFDRYIHKANTLFWNGAMGKAEDVSFSDGTVGVARLIGRSPADVRIASGGDTVGAIHDHRLARNFTFISTGGGATLEFLAGRDLPGVQALQM
jgi:phosphoglycerate kinase